MQLVEQMTVSYQIDLVSFDYMYICVHNILFSYYHNSQYTFEHYVSLHTVACEAFLYTSAVPIVSLVSITLVYKQQYVLY
jgi:hypothetical protein